MEFGERRRRGSRDFAARIMPHIEPAGRLADRDGSVPAQDLRLKRIPTPARVKPGDPAAHAVLSALEAALARIQASEAEARRGDSEGIHRLRTATRRLRSELRAFHDLIDPQWLERV